MNLQKVIELGNKIKEPELEMFTVNALSIAIGVIFLVLLLIAITSTSKDVVSVAGGFAMLTFIVGFWTLFTLGLVNFDEATKTYEKDLAKWETEVAHAYIETLPTEKQEVSYVKISAEHRTEDGDTYKSSTDDIKRVRLTVAYTDQTDNLVTQTEWFEAKMTLPESAKPYMEFNHLKEDLPHGLNKGLYNATIYLPKGYQFTDIK